MSSTFGRSGVPHGFVALEALGGFGLPLDCDESCARLLAMFVAGLRQPAVATRATESMTH